MLIVKKFGGTSLGSPERIESVAKRVAWGIKNRGEHPVLVASAMSGETNRLVSLAHQVSPSDLSPDYDMLLASGEQVSVALLSMALNKRGVKARAFLAFQLGILTNAFPGKATIESIAGNRLMEAVDQGIVPVVAGFQGVDAQYNITTLGRGGSDTTAVALAQFLKSSVCEVYTDVSAIYTADPRLIPQAQPLKKVYFEEMMEMASLGSKVLHVRSVELAGKYRIKIHLRSAFEEKEGTWVIPQGENMEKPVVTAFTHDPNVSVFQLFPIPEEPEFLAGLFSELAEKGIVVDIISQSQSHERGHRLAFSVHSDDMEQARQVVFSQISSKTHIELIENVAKVSVVGVGMQNQFGVASRFFSALARKSIPIRLVTTSDIKISTIVEKDRLEEAASVLHNEFGLDIPKEE